MQPAINNKSISEVELCVRLRKSPRTLFNWRQSGIAPPYFKIKKQIRYLLSDVIAFEENRHA